MNIQRKIPPHSSNEPGPNATPEDVCRMMGKILGGGVDVHRCLAAQALGRIGEFSAMEPLVKALLDEDSDVRTDAAEALSKIADADADAGAGRQLLENLLGDPCTEVKLAAIETLAKLQDKAVIPWLRKIVKGRDEEIAWDEDEFYDSGWDDWVDVQVKAVEALATLNVSEAVSDIVDAMRDEDAQDMTEVVFRALARMGKPGIDALAAVLDEDSVRLRRRAASILGASNDRYASEPLSRALVDPSASVRMAAMRSLAVRMPTDARLAVLLDDPDAEVRAEAINLFGNHYSDRIPALLADEATPVQIAALATLEFGPNDQALLTDLRDKITDGKPAVAAAAAKALGAKGGDQTLDDLVALLADEKRPVEIRLGALQGLTASGCEAAIPTFVDVIGDESRPLRLEAMTALARIAQAGSVWPNVAGTALLAALSTNSSAEEVIEPPVKAEDEKVDEPEAVVEEDDQAFPTSTVAAIMDHEPDAVKVGALQMPGEGIELTPVDMERLAIARNIKGKKRMVLAQNVKRHDDVRRFAARILGDIHRPEVATALAAVITDRDEEMRLAAADSLARLGEFVTPLPADVDAALIAALETAKPSLKLLLIRALAASGEEGANDILRVHLGDEDSFVRTEAVHALRKRGQAGSEIEALLHDPDPSVRLSAAKAIADAGGCDAVQKVVDFAFSYEGYHGGQAARLLRDLDVAEASGHFMNVLQDPKLKRTWSVAIEALAELNQSPQGAAASAVASSI